MSWGDNVERERDEHPDSKKKKKKELVWLAAIFGTKVAVVVNEWWTLNIKKCKWKDK